MYKEMDALSVVGVLFIGMILACVGSAHFIRMGVEIGERRRTYFVQPAQTEIPIDGFTRRYPGQEAGYVEEPQTNDTFEENIKKHGRAVAYIKGKEVN